MVVCVYVLNVCRAREEPEILEKVMTFLKPGGVAYVAVRRDVEQNKKMKAGYVRRQVHLRAPKLYENAKFCIYEIRA